MRDAIAIYLQDNPAAREIATFGVVGGLATLTHFCVALVLNTQLNVAPLLANLGGYLSAVLISYTGNARLTFRSRILDGGQFLKFIVVSLAGLALGQAITYVGAEVLDLAYIWALTATVTLVPVFTFVASRLWAFAAPAAQTPPGSHDPATPVASVTDRRAWVAIWAIFVIATIPMLAAPVLPMIDYYSHVARYFVLGNIGDNAFLQQAYEARWAILPNIGLDVLGSRLSMFAPPTALAKLLVLAIFAVQYFGLIQFNRQISGRASVVTGLLAAPLLYSFILGWGFANFLLGLGLVFWGAAWWLAKRDRLWLAVPVASLIAVLIFLTHGVAFALYGLLLGCLEIGAFWIAAPRSVRLFAVRMASLAAQAVIPALLFMASPTSQSPDGMTNADESVRRLAQLGELNPRLQELTVYRLATIFRVSESLSPLIDYLAFAAIAAIVGILLFQRRARMPRLAIPALAVAGLLVAIMPPTLFGVGYIADRMPLFMAFVFVGCLIAPPGDSERGRLWTGLLGAVVALKLISIGVAWQSYGRDHKDFASVARQIPAHSVVGFANAANLHRLEAEPRCQMYGPLMILESQAASPIFAFGSQQPIALHGRLDAATRTIFRRDGPRGIPGVQRQLEAMTAEKLFDYVLVCRPLDRSTLRLPLAPVAEQGRFALLRVR